MVKTREERVADLRDAAGDILIYGQSVTVGQARVHLFSQAQWVKLARAVEALDELTVTVTVTEPSTESVEGEGSEAK